MTTLEAKEKVRAFNELKRAEQIQAITKIDGFVVTEKGHDVVISYNGESLGTLANLRKGSTTTTTTTGRVAAPSLSEWIIKYFLKHNEAITRLERLPMIDTIITAAIDFDGYFNALNEWDYMQTKAAKKAAKEKEAKEQKEKEAADNFKALDLDKKAMQLVAMGVFSTLEAAKKHLKKQTA